MSHSRDGYCFNETAQEARAIFVKALRSGEYVQCKGALRRRYPSKESHCCLGVACEEFIKLYPERLTKDVETIGGFRCLYIEIVKGRRKVFGSSLPNIVCSWLGFSSPEGKLLGGRNRRDNLISLNDEKGKDFNEIAQVIEDGRVEGRVETI